MIYRPPYLIQRIKERHCEGPLPAGLAAKYQANQERTPEERAYINGLMPMDYMGSAEFEFGTVPDALRAISDNRADFTRFELTLEGTADNFWHKTFPVSVASVPLYGFCRRGHKDNVKRDIGLFAHDTFKGRTKESTRLREIFGKIEVTHYREGVKLRKPVVELS